MDNFLTFEIQRAGIITLESAYIINTSKNIETIKSRYNFLLTIPEGGGLSIIGILKQGQNDPQYSSLIKLSIESYKASYFDRPLQDYQLDLLSNPNFFDLNNFYCNSLANAMKRFCDEQMEAINAMKNEKAKAKRVAKVLETISAAKIEVQTKCSNTTSYSSALSDLENLETTFNKTS